MISGLPSVVGEDVARFLSRSTDRPVVLQNFFPVSGGCINHGGRLQTSSGDFFIKWTSDKTFPGMFEAEARGLSLLAHNAVIDIPTVAGHHTAGDFQWILMNFVERSKPSSAFWEILGQQLARLHSFTRVNFGLDHDNYIGSLPQQNESCDSWIDFFISKRLDVQLKLAVNSGKADSELATNFARLYLKLPELLPVEKPALLHGDLWSGNVIVNSQGNPCLIDPAVYYGNREAEIAFTSLFGGFDDAFYSAYNETLPLVAGASSRRYIYNLYPLLVHVNLFGGGYINQVKTILKKLAV